MKKEVWILLVFAGVLIISACDQIDISKLSDEDLARISEQAIVCNEPYIRYAAECCLDTNDNKICDRDERELTSDEKEKEDKVNKETPSGINPPVEEPPAEPTKSQRPKDDKLECLDTYEKFNEYTLRDASEELLLSLDQEFPDDDKENFIEGGFIKEGESFTHKAYRKILWELQEKEYKECKKLKDDTEKDSCLRSTGSDLPNYCICEEIKDEEKRSNCFSSVGRKLLDVRICEKATALNYAISCSDDVYNKLGIKNLEISFCDKIIGQDTKVDCYDETNRRIALDKGDVSFCDKINDRVKRDDCYIFSIVNNDKIDLCECNAIAGFTGVQRNIRCIQQAALNRGLELNGDVHDIKCKQYVPPDWQPPSEFVADHSFCVIDGKSCGGVFISPGPHPSSIKSEHEFLIRPENFKENNHHFYAPKCGYYAFAADDQRKYCGANSLGSFYAKTLYFEAGKELLGEIYIKDIKSIKQDITLNLPIS